MKAARQFGKVREGVRLCGARTRTGGTCSNQPMRGRARCRMHGGKSLHGIAHPNYKHGLFSEFCPLGIVRREAARSARRRFALETRIAATREASRHAREVQTEQETARRAPVRQWTADEFDQLAKRTPRGHQWTADELIQMDAARRALTKTIKEKT
jgi:hypothetical protein